MADHNVGRFYNILSNLNIRGPHYLYIHPVIFSRQPDPLTQPVLGIVHRPLSAQRVKANKLYLVGLPYPNGPLYEHQWGHAYRFST